MILIVALVIGVACLIVALNLGIDGLGVFSICWLGITLIAVLVAGVNKLAVQGDLRHVEVVRAAVAQVDEIAAHDIYLEAVSINSDIAQYRYWNRQWWADPFVPDEWDKVEPILIPRGKR